MSCCCYREVGKSPQESASGNSKTSTSISQHLSPAILLCMVHLLEVLLTGNDVIANYFWIWRPDTMQQTRVKGSDKVL